MLLVPTRLAQSAIHGFGVFAAEPIKTGAPVWRFAPGLDMEFAAGIVDTLPAHVQAFFAHYGYLDRNLGRVLGSRSMFALAGAEHRQQRKLLVPPFHGRRLVSYEKIVEEEAVRELASWPQGRAFPTLRTSM